MIFNFSGADSNYPESICSRKGIKITNTKTFKYLGCKIDYNHSGIGHSEINNRINSGNAAFQQNKNLLRNFHINLKTRIIFLNAYRRSRLTYGCQCWCATKDTYSNNLDRCSRLMLRKMIRDGFKRFDKKNDDYRFEITNHQLHQICQTENISLYIQLSTNLL